MSAHTEQLDTTAPGPYGQAAAAYWKAGWKGILPLPARRKKYPPTGFTGATGAFPSYADVYAWTEGEDAEGNICLRLTDDIIGIDVDQYDGKTGGDVIASREAKWGDLPPTWRSTSRTDTVSGIRFYRVPPGLRWPGEVGPGVELVRYAHRYAVVWPSIHPEGRTYRWVRPDGTPTVGEIPTPDDLADLPDEWVSGLTGGEMAVEQPRANLDDTQARGWLQAHGAGDLCDKMRRVVLESLPRINGAGSRHDAAMIVTNRIVWLAAAGHTGGFQALDVIRTAFRAAASDRDEHEFAGEWERLIKGAIARAAAEYPDGTVDDPCTRPFPAAVEEYVASLADRPSPPPATEHGPDESDTTTTPTPTPEADDAVEEQIKRNVYAQQELERLRAQRTAMRMLEAEDEENVIADRVRRRVLDDRAAEEYKRLTEPPAPPFDAGTLAEILARPEEPPMRAEGLIPWSGSALVVAQRKTGKTTLLLNYARALITGEAFLGQFPVIPIAEHARVAFLNYEVSAKQLARWAHEAGVPVDRFYQVNLRGRRNPLAHPDDRAALAATLREQNVEAVIVDPFGRAYTGASQNDNGEVQAFLVDLDMFVRAEVGADDLLLAAHAGWDGERSRGASALEDWGDTIITLTRDPEDEERRYMRAIGRDVEVDEDELTMHEPTRTLTRSGFGSRKNQRRNKESAGLAVKVVQAAREKPGCSKSTLADIIAEDHGDTSLKSGRGAGRLSAAIDLAERQGLLRVEKGKNGTPNRHFAVDHTTGLSTGRGQLSTGSTASTEAEVVDKALTSENTSTTSTTSTHSTDKGGTTSTPLYRGSGSGGGGGRKLPIAGGSAYYDPATGEVTES